jgi:hypothetical protein
MNQYTKSEAGMLAGPGGRTTLPAFLSALLAVAAMLPALATAETVLGLHVASHHFPQHDQNNVNRGLYLRTDAGWTAGFYENSLRRQSVYGGRTWDIEFRGFRPAVTAMLVTGYRYAVVPLIVPSVATPAVDGWRARLAYAPFVDKSVKSAHVLHISIEKKF